jgi:hypothetical protein
MRPNSRLAISALAVALAGCGDGPTAPSTPTEMFDAFWATFDREYSYFDYKRVNWDSLRTVFRPHTLEVRTEYALISLVLKQMVAPLRDLHVRFVSPDGSVDVSHVPGTVVNWDSVTWTKMTGRCGLVFVNSDLGHCRMDGVGYVFVRSWNDSRLSIALLDAVVDHYRDAPAIIIDVRPNVGGADNLPLAFAGRFAASETTIGYISFRNGPSHADFGEQITRRISPRGAFQYAKPVIVLAGRGALSANETFISAMRELPTVTILGDTTGGSSGNPRHHRLGAWTYTVSRWIEWTADRRVIEWNGIPPDSVVRWDPNVVALGEDPVLAAALERLTPLVR